MGEFLPVQQEMAFCNNQSSPLHSFAETQRRLELMHQNVTNWQNERNFVHLRQVQAMQFELSLLAATLEQQALNNY